MAKKETELDNYLKLPEDKHLNDLAQTLFILEPDRRNRSNTAHFIRKNFELTIKNFDALQRSPSALKLLDVILLYAVSQKCETVRIPLQKYMHIRGRASETDVRNQLKLDLDLLNSITFKYNSVKKICWFTVGLSANSYGLNNGVIYFRMTPEFYNSIPTSTFMFIPLEYYQMNDKLHPHASFFLRRITLHKRLNLGKINENTIGVKTILESSPGFTKLDNKLRKFKERVLYPFERDMNSINSIKWDYTNKPENIKFEDFINLNIKIEWVEYPDTKKFVENKHAAAAKVLELEAYKKSKERSKTKPKEEES